nr:hypothetical protein [Neorhizobium tomejilense]
MDRVVAGDFKSFEVPVANVADAPVCIAFERLERYNFFDDHAVRNRADIRYFDGAFYRARTDDGRPVAIESLPKRILVDYSEFGSGLGSEQVLMEESGRAKQRPTFQGDTLTDEDEILEALDNLVGKLLVIDGAVWEKCSEPVLVVEEDISRKCSYVSPGFTDTYQPDKRSSHYIFDIDQIAEAVRFAERRSAHVGEEIEVRVAADVSVFAPELLGRGQAFSDILRHAHGFLAETGKITHNEASAAYSRTWHAFHDAFVAARHEIAEDGIETLLDAWNDMVEEHSARFPDKATPAVRQVLESWREYFDERPVTETSVLPGPKGP